jgi:hypothetical protein
MSAVLEHLDRAIATFDSDPPANDYHRGHLEALKVARAELAGIEATFRDDVLEEAATVVEESTSWGLSPTKLEAVKSFQGFAAKAIRAQRSDSEERRRAEAAR